MTTTREPTCQELVELVTAYLEDALATEDRAIFDEHLSDCDGCGAYLEQMRATIRVAGRLESEALHPAVEETLLAAFRDWRRKA